MAKPFPELRERLLRAGVAPRYVRRYIAELDDHLADLTAQEENAGLSRAQAKSSAMGRLGSVDGLAKAMIDRPELRSWSARMPWMTLGIAPICCLAAAYFAACLILWSGWVLFEPGKDTPFVKVDGFAMVYFGIGRYLYVDAPLLIGWGSAVVAIRQRTPWFWPVIGWLLVASMGALARVHTGHPVVPGGAGPVSMKFGLGDSIEKVYSNLSHVFLLFSLSAVPWLLGFGSRLFRSSVSVPPEQ